MTRKATPEELRGRIAVSPAEAATLLGIDRSTLYRRVMPQVYVGRIKSLKIGHCQRILVASLLAWVEAEAERAAA